MKNGLIISIVFGIMASEKQIEDIKSQVVLSRASLDKATIGYIHFARDRRIVYANPFACKTLGYSFDEILVKNAFDIDSTLTEERWGEIWKKLREQLYFSYSSTCIRKDCSAFPIEARAYLLSHNGEQAVGMFIKDLSEKRKLEYDALLKQFIFQKSATAILQGRDDGRILDVNEQTCRNLGYTKEELCSMTVYDLDATFTEGEIGEIWDTTQDKNAFTFETMHRRKDGTVFPVEITANSMEYDGREFSICYMRDITERKRRQLRREKERQQLQKVQKLEALGILAGGIAHDFNNILSGILGYAELAKLKLNPQDETQKYLQPILVAGQRAKQLVNQILTFSRQEESKKTPVDLSRVIDESLDLIRASIPSTIEIKRDIQQNLGFVLADETMIHQIVMNLCTNAYQAMEKKGGAGKLDVLLERKTVTNNDRLSFSELVPGNYLQLTVADSGNGMDRETVAKIFDPYFTTKESGEGTGLGLSVVHGIIKEHGGTIRVYSEPGIGATFHVLLPVEDTGAEGSPTSVESVPKGTEEILIVDDEEIILNIGKEYLTNLGYHVETRASSIDALEAVRARPGKYDLIISDLTMPYMSGDIFANEIRQIRAGLPIILCTGYSNRLDREFLKGIGIRDILMKPVLLHELASSIRKALDGSTESEGH